MRRSIAPSRLLEERGILERRDFGGGRARYEPTEHGRHYHLIDVDTGRVIEFEDTEQEKLMEQIATRLGFDLVSTRLEIYGRRPAEKAAGQAAASVGANTPAPTVANPSVHPSVHPGVHPGTHHATQAGTRTGAEALHQEAAHKQGAGR